MRFTAAVGGGLLPSAVAGAAAFLDVCSVDAVLEYFSCQKPVPHRCVDSLVEQATDFCSNYLSIEPVTIYASTETPVATEIIRATFTTSATTTKVTLTTVETTSSSTVFIVEDETVTATVTAAAGVQKRIASKPVVSAKPSCVDLIKKNLLRHPAWKLSRACSCLNPKPTTITIGMTTASTSTTTSTQTTMVIVVVPETSVSTEVTTVVIPQPVTVTSTATATTTVQPPPPTCERCACRYNPNGEGIGNRIETPPASSAEECCELCYAKPNCIASAYPGSCQHLVKDSALAGAETTAMCPLGVENYFAPGMENPSGVVMRGPCAA
ncbi:hypothetical protein N657DRAFT_692646 [Parathielavia appendiculata]|uniref:Apple domain-containing protein n=1 Tax=Parathielavia appendiculata TaxID=2587402 RepID=A0AAN6TV23_9PEZI|nr:hypothetical protein N657DRAFT_692646 [Parathielavia appendiculata]